MELVSLVAVMLTIVWKARLSETQIPNKVLRRRVMRSPTLEPSFVLVLGLNTGHIQPR